MQIQIGNEMLWLWVPSKTLWALSRMQSIAWNPQEQYIKNMCTSFHGHELHLGRKLHSSTTTYYHHLSHARIYWWTINATWRKPPHQQMQILRRFLHPNSVITNRANDLCPRSKINQLYIWSCCYLKQKMLLIMGTKCELLLAWSQVHCRSQCDVCTRN